MSRNPTFIAFVDESGCDGDKFGKGSSDFLILSAAVGNDAQRNDIEMQIDLTEGAVRKTSPAKRAEWTIPKFEKANNTVRWAMCGRFTEAPFYSAHVLIHKPSIKNVALRTDRNRLYRYASKFLVERISWICEALAHPLAGGDGKCEIVFSEDKSRSYDAFKDYIALLERKKLATQSSIKWDYITAEHIVAHPFKSDPGLLLADYNASSLLLAAEKKTMGQYDERFARILGQQILKSPLKGNSPFGFGYKFWPAEAEHLFHSKQFRWMKEV